MIFNKPPLQGIERAGTPSSYPIKHNQTSAVKTNIPHTPSLYWVYKRAAKNIRLHMQKTFSRRHLPLLLPLPLPLLPFISCGIPRRVSWQFLHLKVRGAAHMAEFRWRWAGADAGVVVGNCQRAQWAASRTDSVANKFGHSVPPHFKKREDSLASAQKKKMKKMTLSCLLAANASYAFTIQINVAPPSPPFHW